MRLEFIGKTKGKVTKVGGFTIKLGQKDTRPAAQLRVMATVPNAILDKFSPGMREFLFEKAAGSEKMQKQLEGVEVVSDLPNLREPGVKLGALHWDDEQTGCTFIIDRAIDPIRVSDCKINKFKIAPKDGGTVNVFFTLTTGEIDQDTAGELLLLNQQEVLFELTAPQVLQQELPDSEDTPDEDTPEKALGRSVGQKASDPAWPFPQSGHDHKAGAAPAAKKASRRGKAVTPITALKKADKAARKSA